MDYQTIELLNETNVTLRSVMENEAIVLFAVIALFVLTVFAIQYIDERWTFYPRKRQRKGYYERF